MTTVLLLSLGSLGGLVGCTGASDRAAPTPQVATVVRWHGQPLRAPFAADDRAILVAAGGGPAGTTRDDARAIAHALLHDTAAGRRDVPGCDGCVTPTARIAAVVSGRVTVSPAVRSGDGERHVLHDQPAWVVAYLPPQAMGCPNQPAGRPDPPATASALDALIVTGSGPTGVLAYHGAATGSCAPRVRPDVSASVSPGIDLGEPG